jgi:hypothetical protein
VNSPPSGTVPRPTGAQRRGPAFCRTLSGTVARLTNDKQTLVLRTVNRPRMLHPPPIVTVAWVTTSVMNNWKIKVTKPWLFYRRAWRPDVRL